jgi:hypothetical protein
MHFRYVSRKVLRRVVCVCVCVCCVQTSKLVDTLIDWIVDYYSKWSKYCKVIVVFKSFEEEKSFRKKWLSLIRRDLWILVEVSVLLGFLGCGDGVAGSYLNSTLMLFLYFYYVYEFINA